MTIPQNNLETFCNKWKIKTVYFFGSVLRPDFRLNESDIDMMVDFLDSAEWTLLDHVEMRYELIHSYEDADLEEIWKTIQIVMPELISKLSKI